MKSTKHNHNSSNAKHSIHLNNTSCLDHTCAITTKSDNNNISNLREQDHNDVILTDTSIDSISNHTNTVISSSSSFSTTEYQYGEYEDETTDDTKDLYTHLKQTFWQIFTPASK